MWTPPTAEVGYYRCVLRSVRLNIACSREHPAVGLEEDTLEKRSLLESKFADSTVFLAVSSLILYLVVATYLRGYLRFFGAEPYWFNPSFFQLVSFCNVPLIVGIGLITCYHFFHKPWLFRPWSYFLIALIWTITILSLGALNVAAFQNSPIGLWPLRSIMVSWVFFAFTPFILGVAYIIAVHVLKRQVTPQEIGHQAVSASRVVSFLFFGGLSLWLTYNIGTANASMDALSIQAVQNHQPLPQVQAAIFFTDGNCTLKGEFAGQSWVYVYHNPVLGFDLRLKQS